MNDKNGHYNYTMEPVELDKLNSYYQIDGFCGIIGCCPAMREIFRIIMKIAHTDITALITGPSGTGKELIAKAIHALSPRARYPLITVNCGALTELLLETELFGHIKGAFTGASFSRIGRFKQADGGTLFLDEVGEMSPAFQVKLLRVLQFGTFERLGENRTTRVDVRVLAATNRNLKQGVEDGWFREDLFYRLNVLPIQVPTLKDRGEDISLLIENFLRSYGGHNGSGSTLSPEAFQALRAYAFPGNVRELENIIQNAVTLADGPLITLSNLQSEVRKSRADIYQVSASYNVRSETLLEALKKIAHFTKEGEEKLWYEGLRCITIDDIHRFLVMQGNKWFSRSRFEEFLRTCSGSDVDKYKTAGVYLQILKSSDILTHNGRQANPSAYCLANRFITSNKHS